MLRYLDCGLYENGFARIRCPECSDEYLLAFSCKTRELCPSCAAKRSAATAALLARYIMRPSISPIVEAASGCCLQAEFEIEAWERSCSGSSHSMRPERDGNSANCRWSDAMINRRVRRAAAIRSTNCRVLQRVAGQAPES